MAMRYWEQAGIVDKIDLRLAPALKTLDGLLQEGRAGDFDMAFIDADKENYLNYYERCLELLRPGGLIMVDNVLWGGSVVDASNQKPETMAIRELNEHVHRDSRVDISLVPIGDGLTLARKR
jgi:caffeoyl-CoA O-methyltransferase